MLQPAQNLVRLVPRLVELGAVGGILGPGRGQRCHAVHVPGGLGGDEVNYLRRAGPVGQLLLGGPRQLLRAGQRLVHDQRHRQLGQEQARGLGRLLPPLPPLVLGRRPRVSPVPNARGPTAWHGARFQRCGSAPDPLRFGEKMNRDAQQRPEPSGRRPGCFLQRPGAFVQGNRDFIKRPQLPDKRARYVAAPPMSSA